MVKGVNKTIIEVNDTGSRLFEKIVFYVTPEYGNMSAKRLQKAACDFSFSFEDGRVNASLRKRIKAKNMRHIRLIALGAALILIAAVVIFKLVM